MCAGGFVYFVENKLSYFSVSGPDPLLLFLITPIKQPNVSKMCSRYKTSRKLCSFSATDCSISNVY